MRSKLCAAVGLVLLACLYLHAGTAAAQVATATARLRLVRSTAQCANSANITVLPATKVNLNSRLTIMALADQNVTVNVFQGDAEDVTAGVLPVKSAFNVTNGTTQGAGQGISVELLGPYIMVQVNNVSGTATNTCQVSVWLRSNT